MATSPHGLFNDGTPVIRIETRTQVPQRRDVAAARVHAVFNDGTAVRRRPFARQGPRITVSFETLNIPRCLTFLISVAPVLLE